MKHFHDGFETGRDFLAVGVGGSGWDGFLGKGERETADRIEAAEGQLYLQSTKGRYQEGWNPLGPLLFKTVQGDFKATVRVVDYEKLSYNNCGIMARVADLDDAGPGEDWISVDYFPIYGGIYARMADDNRRSEKGNNGQGRNADRYLQLELVGNLVFLRHSLDGVNWEELPASPIVRNDMVNVPLQVGLFQATYTNNQGQVSFDDFSLDFGAAVPTARLPNPITGAVDRPPRVTLSWVPGGGATAHDLYVGRSRDAVATATQHDDAIYRGRQQAVDLDYELTDLEDGKTYYWRVDEVNEDDAEIHRGEIWEFTVYDRDLTSFEQYDSTAALQAQWVASEGGVVSLVRDGDVEHPPSMQLELMRGSSCRADFAFAENQDWFSSTYGFRLLRVVFKGKPDNQLERLYLAFEDNDWGVSRTVVEYDGDPADLLRDEWTCWNIDLRRLVENNPSFRLDQVKSMAVGVDREETASPDKTNIVWIRGISIDGAHQADDAGRRGPSLVQPGRFVESVPFGNVTVTGGIWRERMDVNREVSLPHVWDRCEYSKKANGEDSKRLDNFRVASGQMKGDFTGTFFNDSDVYKILEGTANSLQNHPDPKLETYADKVIESIAGAQWEDGYLYTFYTLPQRRPEARWSNVGSMHELYCAGHLMEAAVAYHQATGKRQLLDVAIRLADLICDTFGPGKRTDAPGHQEIELALIRLGRATGNERYIDQAKYFIDRRGQTDRDRLYGTYSQDHIPFVQQEKGVGHSVRAGYLFCAATDIAMLQENEAYANALLRLWDNIVNTKTYLSGGIGQPGGPEGFAGDYQLGNNCYAETCSGIAFAMWNHRLHQMTGESKYEDLVERTLLNNMLSSLSVEGDCHFYTNPLSTGGRERWPWPGHDCACCPSNLVRVISSIGGYVYSHNDDTILVNQYIASQGTVSLKETTVSLEQTTEYPWDGEIAIHVRPKVVEKFGIKLRIPGWARNQPMPGNLYRFVSTSDEPVTVDVNGSRVDAKVDQGYVEIRRTWSLGDVLRLHLPMPVRRIIAHPKAVADKGLVAVQRGPILYCAEFKDNEIPVSELELADEEQLTAMREPDLFSGVVTIRGQNGLKLIPYYLYANRGPGWMRVWLPRRESR